MAALSEEARIVECVLFIENEAMDIEKLASMTGLTEQETAKSLKEIKKYYEKDYHGIMLKLNDDETYSFVPSPDLYDRLRITNG